LVEKSSIKKTFRKFYSSNKAIVLLAVLYSITHLQYLSFAQYWDSNWYWVLLRSGVGNLKEVALRSGDIVRTFIESFNFLGHPSMGYVGLMSISQFIDYGNVALLNIENVILAVLAIYAFYRIAQYFFPERGTDNILITAIFAFNPLFYATSISFNLDFGVLIFEVLMFEAIIYRKFLWFLLWATILIFTKEIGIIIFLSFIVAYLLFFALKRWWKSKRRIEVHKVLFWILPLMIFGVYFYYTRGNLWKNVALENTGNTNFFTWNDNGMFTFGMNTKNVIIRLFQIFVMNFGWVSSFTVIAIWLKAEIFGERLLQDFSEEKRDIARVLGGTFFVFLVFNLLTIVMPFSRYVVPGVFFTVLIFYLLVQTLNRKHFFIRRAVLALVLLLTVTQTFKAIDPSPQILFGKNYLGENVSSPFFGFHDGLVYNSEFVFVDKLEKKTINYLTGGSSIVLDKEATYFFKDIKQVGTLDSLDKIYRTGVKKLRYIHIPWFGKKEESLAKINKYYSIQAERTVDYKGYFVEIYDLKAL